MSSRSRRHLAAATLAKGCAYYNEDDAADPLAEMDAAVAYYHVDDAKHEVFATVPAPRAAKFAFGVRFCQQVFVCACFQSFQFRVFDTAGSFCGGPAPSILSGPERLGRAAPAHPPGGWRPRVFV